MKTINLLKQGVLIILVSIISTGITSYVISQNVDSGDTMFEGQDVSSSIFKFTGNTVAPDADFTTAAESSVNTVVHVKTKKMQEQSPLSFQQDPFFEYFFGQPRYQQRPSQPIMGSGSGVIISKDGYIVTNNHVIEGADEIEVVLNDKRSFDAMLVGRDPNTDIALLKIDTNDLSVMKFGNSDALRIGEWVLAVGNPFNLTSTVTAGIVSAKARNINIINAEMKIESFIQTDAAVNPGNSGGALVNTKGELVGINTAIASQTGSYTGYSFAVPVSIVAKVVADIKEFGEVQRAILGVTISDITDELAEEKELKTLEGAYVRSVVDNSAADEAGIKEGDVIKAVNEVSIKSVSELTEQIARYSPGDKVKVRIERNNMKKSFDVKLKNKKGNTSLVKSVNLKDMGASFEEIKGEKLNGKIYVKSGIQVVGVINGGKFDKAGIQKGFVILKINNRSVSKVSDIENAIKHVESSLDTDDVLFIAGIYPNGSSGYYAISLEK